MDRITERKTRIERRRVELIARYPEILENIITEWQQSGPDNRAWLMYSANYLFRTGGIRWALDPLTLTSRLGIPGRVDLIARLKDLSFVLLSHRHTDHLDFELITTLRDAPIQWIIPEFMQAEVLAQTGLTRKQIRTPQALQEIVLDGIHILPFPGGHWERLSDGRMKGVPSMGYRITIGDQRWLLAGDTRTYDAKQLADLGPVEGSFAHIWLGRASALDENPPLLEDFCRFHLAFLPRQIILTHLEEVGRVPTEYWDDRHVKMVADRLEGLSPGIQTGAAKIGESIWL